MTVNNIFIYPTDTVWGIGASIHSPEGNEFIAEVKGTNSRKPLSVLFTKIEDMESYLDTSLLDVFFEKQLFDCELSVGLPISKIKNDSIPSFIYQDSNVVFVRLLPSLAPYINHPITTTSANFTGDNPVSDRAACETFIKYVESESRRKKMTLEVIDFVMPLSGNSSTMMMWEESGWKVLREGARYEYIARELGLLSA